MIESILQHHGGNGVDEIAVGDLAMRGDALLGVLFVLAPESHHQVSNRQTQELILLFVSGLEFGEFLQADFFEIARFAPQAIGFGMIQRPHVRFRDGCDGAQHALLAAARAGAVAGNQRVVVAPHHQQIAQGGGLGVLRVRIVVEAQIFLRSVRQEVQECGSGLMLGVDVLGLLHHAQRLVIAASGHARGASFAEVGNENGKDAAASRGLPLRSGKDRVDLLEGHRNFLNNGEELAFRLVGESVHLIGNLAKDLGKGRSRFCR